MDTKRIIEHLKAQAQKAIRQRGEIDVKLYFIILYPGQTTPVYFPIPVNEYMDNSFTKNKLPFFVQYCWDKKRQNPRELI